MKLVNAHHASGLSGHSRCTLLTRIHPNGDLSRERSVARIIRSRLEVIHSIRLTSSFIVHAWQVYLI